MFGTIGTDGTRGTAPCAFAVLPPGNVRFCDWGARGIAPQSTVGGSPRNTRKPASRGTEAVGKWRKLHSTARIPQKNLNRQAWLAYHSPRSLRSPRDIHQTYQTFQTSQTSQTFQTIQTYQTFQTIQTYQTFQTIQTSQTFPMPSVPAKRFSVSSVVAKIRRSRGFWRCRIFWSLPIF